MLSISMLGCIALFENDVNQPESSEISRVLKWHNPGDIWIESAHDDLSILYILLEEGEEDIEDEIFFKTEKFLIDSLNPNDLSSLNVFELNSLNRSDVVSDVEYNCGIKYAIVGVFIQNHQIEILQAAIDSL